MSGNDTPPWQHRVLLLRCYIQKTNWYFSSIFKNNVFVYLIRGTWLKILVETILLAGRTLHRDFSLCGLGDSSHPGLHAGRCGHRRAILHCAQVGSANGHQCNYYSFFSMNLTCSSPPSVCLFRGFFFTGVGSSSCTDVLLPRCFIRWDHHVCQLQQI